MTESRQRLGIFDRLPPFAFVAGNVVRHVGLELCCNAELVFAHHLLEIVQAPFEVVAPGRGALQTVGRANVEHEEPVDVAYQRVLIQVGGEQFRVTGFDSAVTANIQVPSLIGCNHPDVLALRLCALTGTSRDAEFDLVYSNSLIEHVGGHARRCDFASVVHTLASHHWVQTPYRYFPIEPHWLFPGLQFLPQRARAWAIRRWPLSPAWPNPEQALRDVLEVELLSETEMKYYFPGSELLKERVLGLTKSIIVVA